MRAHRHLTLPLLAAAAAAALAAAAGGVVSAAPPKAPHPHAAAAGSPGGYPATDLLGQTNGSGQPLYTQNGCYNSVSTNCSSSSANAIGFDYNNGVALDTLHHRLFVSDCGGDRVLVFALDASNTIGSRTAVNVLGQPDFTHHASGSGQRSLRCAEGASYDPTHDRLFVPDASNKRVLVFDLSHGITNGMNASWVLGEPDFTTTSGGTSQSRVSGLYGGSIYDSVHQRFILSDSNNYRVLIWDLSGGTITNGMNAAHVLGQQTFLTKVCLVTQSNMHFPYSLAYDTSRQLLFVGDTKWGSNAACRPPAAQAPQRVLVFDLSHGISDGMNASYVLGQPNFTSFGPNSDLKAATQDPEEMAYDELHQRVFVQDDVLNRVLVFDVATIHNGMEASAVIGQSNFTSHDYSCHATQTNQCDAEGLSDAFDSGNNRYYLSDSSQNRVLVFNFVTITSTALANGTQGAAYSQPVATRGSEGTLGFALTSGSLPPGLMLNSSTGTISGTPATTGTFNFTVRATDTFGNAGFFWDARQLSITVTGITVPNTGVANGMAAGILVLLVGAGGVLAAMPLRRRTTRG